MEMAPPWLRALVSEDGLPVSASMSIRPALAEEVEAMRAERLARRRTALPQAPVAAEEAPSDARRLADVLDREEAGSRPYLLLGRIGEGGMGVVHRARQRSTGREVAVKAVLPDRSQPRYLAAFRQECRITANLEHPNVPPVYDAGADFMVMKRLTGRSLEERLLAAPGGPGLGLAVEALLKVCDALAYAHARGVVHRDLKGDNVMVGDFGEVWVMDWGLAAAFAPQPDGTWLAPAVRDRESMCAGTPMCVSPEVAVADPGLMGPGVDLFMLGALLYRVLSGSYPYQRPTGKESLRLAARRDFVPLLVRAPGAPFRLLQAAERAMAWEPADRGSVADFASDLRTWLHTSGATVEARTLIDRARDHLAAGNGQATATGRYTRLASAMADAERALQLCPELREAHQAPRP